MKRKFEAEGLNLNFLRGRWYLRAYLGPRKKLKAWVRSNVEAWSHGVHILGKLAKWLPSQYMLDWGFRFDYSYSTCNGLS